MPSRWRLSRANQLYGIADMESPALAVRAVKQSEQPPHYTVPAPERSDLVRSTMRERAIFFTLQSD